MTDLTHIHYSTDRNDPEPYVGTPVSTLCGIFTGYVDNPRLPVCIDCYTRAIKIKQAEFTINSSLMLQLAADERRLMETMEGVDGDG